MKPKDKETDIRNLDELLEGRSLSKTAGQTANLNVLAEAQNLGIDLESLEVPVPVKVKVMPKATSSEVSVPKNAFWENMDVNLADVVNYVLNSSERPVIMVSDDKAVYFNYAAMQLLEIRDSRDVIGEPFLSFVEKSDWNLMAENIGEMLTKAKKLSIKMLSASGKVNPVEFQAIYLPDSTRFSFILIGAHTAKSNKPFFNNLYDELTGLPNFFLFEDRVQMAVNNENYKDSRLPKDLVAVAVISIDNLEMFKKLRLDDFAIKKLANTLVFSLKKNYSVARGLKYNFWVLMPGVVSHHDLDVELHKLLNLFSEGITDNFTNHEVVVSIGASVFPNPARSAKKLVEQAISALKKAQKSRQSSLEIFEQEKGS